MTPDGPLTQAVRAAQEVDRHELAQCGCAGLRDQIENLRTTVEMDLIYQRRLEAILARVEALVRRTELLDGNPMDSWVGTRELRAALGIRA